MAIVPFGEWLPDQADLSNPGSTAVNGVYPRTATSYGPVASLSNISDALDSAAIASFSGRRGEDGTIYTFAATADKIYRLNSTAWTDVSSGTYTIGAEERREFVQYGDRVITVAMDETTESYDLGTLPAAFSTLAATAPKARHIAVIRDFVVVGNTWDSSDGYQPNRVWWSGIDDPTNWPTPGSSTAAQVQSDYQTLPTGGWVQCILGAVGGADGLVFTETSIYRMTYEGPPTIFRFDEIERLRGTPAPASVVNVGPFAAYLSDDGFYLCDGMGSKPIGGGKVDKYFFSQLNQSYYHKITATADPINKLVIWSYPDGATGETPNRVIIWNWQYDRWAQADLSCELLFRAKSLGYTLDGLDAVSSTLDALPFSLDSRVWTGGRVVLGGFTTAHKLAFLSGSNQAATLTTAEIDGSGKRIFCAGIRPLVDGGTVTASIGKREAPGGSVTYSTATSPGADGNCPQRTSGRFLRAKVSIAAGGSWSHAQGVEPVLVSDGGR